MLDTSTKKRIDDCRDILVGKLPDPKAQIEQITIGLIYKFMDDMDKEAVELGGAAKFFTDYTVPDPDDPTKTKTVEFAKYGWDNLFDARVTATEMLNLYAEAIQGMDKNPNIPGLFRDIFKNAFLPYRDPETLKLFLKTIGEFEYTHSEKLGDAFEYLLSVMGSQGDAGQFRTPRHIIDFLVAIVDPGKNDTILDPACGTAGFLISAYKYITDTKKDALTPDERKKLIRNFAGYDISPDMVRLSLVNLYLHGFPDPHIVEYDTLSSEERWNESYDVILANPPFMSPKGGIRPHKKFTISSNRSEVLFVDYIAEHLNPNGRAGIIVPEGVIFQSGTAYKELRKMLVNGYLYAVVSLPAGVFNPYSGVKTSILLMDKTLARQRDEVLFVKIDNDGYNLGAQRNAVKGGQLDEAIALIHAFARTGTYPESTLALVVPKTEIAKNGDYNLSGERYRVNEILSSDFEQVELGELCEIIGGGTPSKSESNYWENGNIKWISSRHIDNSGNIIGNDWITNEGLENSSSKIAPKNSIIFITRVSVGKYAIANDDFAINQDLTALVPKNENLSNRYLFAIAPLISEIINKTATGIGVRGITKKQLENIQIPLPPLAVQEEIVAEIEGYQKIIDGAKAVLAHYKPKIDIDPDWEMVELGEVCRIKGGNAFKSTDYIDNGAQLIRMGNVKQMFFDHENSPSFLPIQYVQEYPNYVLERGDLLISMTGTVGKEDYGNVCKVDVNGDFLLNQRVGKFEIFSDKLDQSFLYYVANTSNFRKQLFANSSGGVRQANISNKGIESIEIPLPPLETQRQIVAQIEKEQALVNANKQLVEIFEQKIKNRIAKVWGTSAETTITELPTAKPIEEVLPMAAESDIQFGIFE